MRLDLTFAWDIRPAATTDDLSRALDYAAVNQHVQAFSAAACYELVETFAERLAESLLAQFAMPWLRLRVTKPGANPLARGVGVEIERSRA